MTGIIIAGCLAGLGAFLLVMSFVRPRPGIAATIARIDTGNRGGMTRSAVEVNRPDRVTRARDSLGSRLEAEAAVRGWKLTSLRANLAVMNRTMSEHLGTKVLLLIGALIFLPFVMTAAASLGVWMGSFPTFLIVVGGSALAFMLPDLALRSEAEARRRDFRHVVGSFLDLVAMNLAGGRGLPEALMAASSVGDHWAMVRLRQALSNARVVGLTPWEGISRLGNELGVEELRDLSSALALAGDEGAQIRLSLMSRAESLRRKELADAEGEAGEKSQSMLVAQLLICVAFLLFLGFPAVGQLLGI